MWRIVNKGIYSNNVRIVTKPLLRLTNNNTRKFVKRNFRPNVGFVVRKWKES